MWQHTGLKNQIYDGKCKRFLDWILEVSPSFLPPRSDTLPIENDLGAAEYYRSNLATLNTKYNRLLELIAQRLRTAIEVNGINNLVSLKKLQPCFFYAYMLYT